MSVYAGQSLTLEHRVVVDGVPTNAASVTLTATLPDGTSEPITVGEPVTTGLYRVTYTPMQPGRWVFAWQTTDPDTADAVAVWVVAVGAMPTVADVVDYLGGDADQWTEEELSDALAAEMAAQRRWCDVGAEYPDDLRQALLRRVARNLAMRSLPLAVLQGDAEVGPVRLPGQDAEVRRLEAPHRRMPVR